MSTGSVPHKLLRKNNGLFLHTRKSTVLQQFQHAIHNKRMYNRLASLTWSWYRSRLYYFCDLVCVGYGNAIQKEVKFSVAGESISTVKETPVKSLGRWYVGTLSDRSRGIEVMNQAEQWLTVIYQSILPGKYKIWCLQFGLYPRLTWPLMIYDVALFRVEIIEQKISVCVRKWLGLPKVTNSSV